MRKWLIRLGLTLLCIAVFGAGCGMAQEDNRPEAQSKPKAQAQDKEQNKELQQQQKPNARKQQPQQKYKGSKQGGSKPQTQADKKPQIDKDVLEQARIAARQVDGVKEVAAVAIDKDLSVAVNVAQMKRFQLKSIRKEIFQKLKKDHPDMTVHVTTDRKVFWEMEKLERQAYAQHPNAPEIHKKLQKLNEDMKG